MRILITGANGLVGTACQLNALKMKLDISIVSSKRNIFPSIKCYGSLSEIKNKEFDILIHCASATPNNSDFDQIFQINRKIDNNLCDFIKNHSYIKHVIYLSTMSVYGSINLDLIDENTEPISPNQYGLSKLLGEIDLEKTCNKSNKKLAILRLPGVIGKKMPEVFFKRLYDSILSQTEITIRSKKSQFNNAVLDSDIFHTALKIFDNQKDNKIILNHHSENILTLEKLIHYTSELIGKKSIIKETQDCNPPFLISNNNNDDLLFKSKIEFMVSTFHKEYNS
tara:strand:+ start:103 stop:948 length:846 start_codon:yes stop_codon:yes gene_type:complete